jgi:hypothetical protein
MSVLSKIFGNKDKKDTAESGTKADKPGIKTEINMQDIRDAMMGKNGKMTLMPGVLIDTVIMREVPMRDKPTNFTTIRGIATSLKYFIESRSEEPGTTVMKTENRRSATLINLNIGEKNVYIQESTVHLNMDDDLPAINDGDDVEAMCVPGSQKDLQYVWVLKNHTSGVLWYIHTRIF